MSRCSTAACAILLLTATASWAEDLERRVISSVSLIGSESVRLDADSDRYLVDNLGQGGESNHGFVSVIDPNLWIAELKWIRGGREGVTLGDPLGLIISGDVINVADAAAVRRFDRVTGSHLGSTDVLGTISLNDLAIDESGNINVTHSGSETTTSEIYPIWAGSEVSVFAERDAALLPPNGFAITPDGLIVHGGLRGTVLVFRDPTVRIDGIVAPPESSLLVSRQDGQKVYLVDAGEAVPPQVVASQIAFPATIGADIPWRLVLIPRLPQPRAQSLPFPDFGVANHA